VLWGTQERLRSLFGAGISSLAIEEREVSFRFRSADHYVEFFRTYFGPVKMALARLDEPGQEALAADIKDLLGRFNRAGGRALVFPGSYLEIVAMRA
jgi:hypothetical protein